MQLFQKTRWVVYENKRNQYVENVEYNTSQNFYDKLCIDFRAYFPWNKIYKSSIIKDNHIVFPLGIRFEEDTLFEFSYVKHEKNSVYISGALG